MVSIKIMYQENKDNNFNIRVLLEETAYNDIEGSIKNH